MVQPNAEAEDHGQHSGERDGRVADERPAAEDRQRVGDHAHRRQHDDVDPGWANIQKRCCHSSGWPPLRAVEEMRAELAVEPQQEEGETDAGTASRLPAEAVSVPQTMIGTRLIDMPGARMRKIVTMKLTAPTVVEMPEEDHARARRNPCWARDCNARLRRGHS